MDIHPTLLNEIDAVELGASNRAWREAVRTAGFSAYFVQLSNEIQDDVIYRSELSL
jgi:MoxR-like ATPase